jgi:hypothetical protein
VSSYDDKNTGRREKQRVAGQIAAKAALCYAVHIPSGAALPPELVENSPLYFWK